MKDRIDIYKDQPLLKLVERSAILNSDIEKINFQLSEKEVGETSQTLEDLYRKEIAVYEQINTHVYSNYKNSTLTTQWIAINQFRIDRLKENLRY